MHDLFARVLNHKDLSKAGELFSIDDKDIAEDLSDIMEKIQEISDSPVYLQNDNDQSVVEICITRVTSSIRETKSIEQHSAALMSLLKSCLGHDLKHPNKDEDTPHAKIASDILSCIFLHYAKRAVMEQAIPVAVNFLKEGNKELNRNVSSYLSLAAIESPDLLSDHVDAIIDSITNGNHSLSRVLPKLYKQNKKTINDRVSELIPILDECETAEAGSLLQLLSLVAQNNAALLVTYISNMCNHLTSATTVTTALQAFVDMAIHNAEPFISHVGKIKTAGTSHPTTINLVAQIIGAVGRLSEIQAIACMEWLMAQTANAENTALPVIIREVKNIAEKYRSPLGKHMEEISKFDDHSCSSVRLVVQQLKDLNSKRYSMSSMYSTSDKDSKSTRGQPEGVVTVVTVVNPPNNTLPGATVTNGRTGATLIHRHNTDVRTKSDRPHSAATVSSTYSERTVSGISNSSSIPAYQYKDTVQHFCSKHFDKIKTYVEHVTKRIPLPIRCQVEEFKHKRRVKVHFLCESKSEQCLYSVHSFPVRTKLARAWIHLMFLQIQAKARAALSQNETSISELRLLWEKLNMEGGSFVKLVTSSFPSTRDQELLRHELNSIRFFDLFEFNASKQHWACFLCNHPEKASGLLHDGHPVIEGHLKEKKGRWKFFKRWKTRYFTLSGAHMTYTVSKKDDKREFLPVSKIQSVKAIKKGSRDLPKAFEIFANDQKFILKPKEKKHAEQWVQALHIAVARSQNPNGGGTLVAKSGGTLIAKIPPVEEETKISRL